MEASVGGNRLARYVDRWDEGGWCDTELAHLMGFYLATIEWVVWLVDGERSTRPGGACNVR